MWYSLEYFIFEIGQALVVETPTYGAATYVFGLQPVEQVTAAMEGVQKLKLRQDERVQQQTQYRGYAIHGTAGWFAKVLELTRE